MNILFMIGNGFDLNLGLKTSYNDFYTYYKSKNSKSEKIEKLKKHISNSFSNWSDLELALGEYTQNIDTDEEFDEIFDDIGENLAQYLLKEETRLDLNNEKTNQKKLFNDLGYPEESLTPANQDELKTYRNRVMGSSLCNVNIITFNYTNSLEKLLDYTDDFITLEGGCRLRKIHHIHGYLDNNMVMGVNDISQIKNKVFHENLNVTEALVKPKCNEVSGHTVDNHCEKLIAAAHLICIFGSSLGDTDKLWWELVAKKLVKYASRLIIFEKTENISPRMDYKKERIRRKKKEQFLDKTTLTAEEKKIAERNIFVGVNTNMFSEIYG